VWWSGRNNKKRLFLRISHAGASAIVERQPKKAGIHHSRHNSRQNQGCQIFLGTKYQNGKKYAKLQQIIPNVHKI
jgi:hypothetical protein